MVSGGRSNRSRARRWNEQHLDDVTLWHTLKPIFSWGALLAEAQRVQRLHQVTCKKPIAQINNEKRASCHVTRGRVAPGNFTPRPSQNRA